MNIVVISLERAKERREYIKSQLASLNIEAIIMDAVDGQNLTDNQKNTSIKNPGKWRDKELFKPGELGCLYSHIKAIKYAKENRWEDVIILEDDVILSKDFVRGINFLFRIIPKDWEHIFLGGHIYLSAPPVFTPSVIPSDFKISGAYSYILKNTVYDKILSELYPMNVPVDDVFEMLTYQTQQIKSYIFFPFLTYPDVSNSYIWGINKDTKMHPSIKYFKNKL